MARKKIITKTPVETVKAPPEIPAAPLGLCRKCRNFTANNKLGGAWVGTCKLHNIMVKDDFSCNLWEAKNG